LLGGRLDGAKRLAILGVGSELRSDDVAGLLVARSIARKFRGKEGLLVVEGGTAPENLTGPLLGFEPSHLVVVDCAELDAPPGSIALFPVESIGGLSSSTHSLPLSVIFDYLRKSSPCEILIVGIMPKSLEFDGSPTREARRAAALVTKALARAIRAMDGRAAGAAAETPAPREPRRP
jgi:hydrogenase 3 maturation protease